MHACLPAYPPACLHARHPCASGPWQLAGQRGRRACTGGGGGLHHTGCVLIIATRPPPACLPALPACPINCTRPQIFNRLYESDGGEVVLVPEGQLAPGGIIASKENPWLGCMKAAGALMDGRVVALLDGVPSADECCRRCRGLETAGGGVCNVWNYCERQGGCRCGGRVATCLGAAGLPASSARPCRTAGVSLTGQCG